VKPWQAPTKLCSILPQKLSTVSCFQWLRKKNFFIQSVKAACLQVIPVYCIDCIRLIVDGYLSSSSPSLLSVVLQTSLLTPTKSTLKKRLVLSNDNKPKKKTQKEPKLAAYDIDWFDSTSTKNKCLKHTSDNNLPSTQEEQLTFLLSKYQASDIKTAFADAISKVGNAARKAF
jgi:hypothetical protein